MDSLARRPGTAIISNLDAECRLIAQMFPGQISFLSPNHTAMMLVTKPPQSVAAGLDIAVPEMIPGSSAAEDLVRFIRASTYGVWVKGQHYEAHWADTYRDAMIIGDRISELWGPPWHIERHVQGQEASIAFVAINGRLIDAVYMEKEVLTDSGKAWSGSVESLDPSRRDLLERWVRRSGWHGGGELELVKSWKGDYTLIELNPRLPAWIHGATVSGYNLPAALIRGKACRTSPKRAGFTRVVTEIPIDADIGMPSYPWSVDAFGSAATKHPSGMPSISARRLVAAAHSNSSNDDSLARILSPSLAPITPALHLSTEPLVDSLRRLRGSIDFGNVEIAYSVKTNPHSLLLRAAADAQMWFECISQEELSLVRRTVDSPTTICNGPAKWDNNPKAMNNSIVFLDNLQEFSMIESAVAARRDEFHPSVIGIRIARDSTSRFGIGTTTKEFRPAIAALARWARTLEVPWGLHFHHAQSTIGSGRWIESASRVLEAAKVMADIIGTPPKILDLGGGWDPFLGVGEASRCLNTITASPSARWINPESTTLVIEPGKLLIQPCGVLQVTVIGTRSAGTELVIDAGIAEVPEVAYWPHSVFVMRGAEAHQLRPGTGRIFGRTCMEPDIVASNLDVFGIAVGDRLLISDVGAYDMSMAYSFARGEVRYDFR